MYAIQLRTSRTHEKMGPIWAVSERSPHGMVQFFVQAYNTYQISLVLLWKLFCSKRRVGAVLLTVITHGGIYINIKLGILPLCTEP